MRDVSHPNTDEELEAPRCGMRSGSRAYRDSIEFRGRLDGEVF